MALAVPTSLAMTEQRRRDFHAQGFSLFDLIDHSRTIPLVGDAIGWNIQTPATPSERVRS